MALVLAFVLPFEMIRPVLSTPFISLTDEKLALLGAAGAWLLQGSRALPTRDEWRALLPALSLLLVTLVAALAAAEFGDEALKFVWRVAAATFVLLVMLRVTREDDHRVGILWAIVLGAGASAVLGIGEALGWRVLDPWLSLFKVAPTRVGGELRASATFQYATIAAMYFEMVTPVAIVLAASATRREAKLLGTAIAAACTANVVLSLTRAGMLTLLLLFGILLICAWRGPDLRRVVAPTLTSAAVLVGGVAILARSNPVFDMRLVTESDADWYGAVYFAPAALTVEPDATIAIDLDVRNEGRIVWSTSEKHPFALGYRWLTADRTGVLDIPPGEVVLPRDVAPGETIRIQTEINVPNVPKGAYRLAWGMLQRDVVQFYERGWANAETLVTIEAEGAAGPPAIGIVPRDDEEAPWVVGRLELWGAALRLIQAHPWLGVGPDNFRHLYGALLGLETWDERIQANNLYLEILADVGVVGFAAFVWMTLASLVNAIRADKTRGAYWVVGIGLGVAAFLVHGLLDSFLAFTPTAVLFWVFLGILSAQKPHVSGRW
jgi:hypothetical protein